MSARNYLFKILVCFLLISFVRLSSIEAWQGPIPETIDKGNIVVELELVADNLVAPNYLTHAGDGTDRLFIVDQDGFIHLIKDGSLQATPYLDASSLIVPLGGIIEPFGDPFRDFDERGLLGVAFHPDFSQANQPGFGKFYTYTSEPNSGTSDFTVELPKGEVFNHQAAIREWTVDPTADVIIGNPASISRVLMLIDEPQFNHDGGMVAFGPDGYLYISLGDGGGGNDDDAGHGKVGNGQDPTNVLGAILRIDPLGNNSANGQYGVPGDNPFVGGPEVDEIFAYGLRNPFRFSFDVDPATGQIVPGTTGQLIVGDVGQGNIEEVDVVQAGDNLGWRLKEGSFFFNHETGDVSDMPFPGIKIPPDFDPVDPLLEYDHDEGITVIGGFVYHGTEIPELIGKYVFGDFTNAGFFNPGGRLFVGDLATGLIEELRIGFQSSDLGLYIKGFGQDANGELYLLGGTNLGPFRDASGQGFGVVMRLKSAAPVGPPNWRGSGFGFTEPNSKNPDVDCQIFSGRSSHIGRFTATGCHEIDADSNLSGTATLEAHNGHQLNVSYEGFVFASDDPNFPLGFTACLKTDGGTGRFRRAKGSAIMTGAFSGSPGEFFFDFQGTFHPRGR